MPVIAAPPPYDVFDGSSVERLSTSLISLIYSLKSRKGDNLDNKQSQCHLMECSCPCQSFKRPHPLTFIFFYCKTAIKNILEPFFFALKKELSQDIQNVLSTHLNSSKDGAF